MQFMFRNVNQTSALVVTFCLFLVGCSGSAETEQGSGGGTGTGGAQATGGGSGGGSGGGTGGGDRDAGIPASASRGEYLVRHLLRCEGCHDATLSGGQAFAGTLTDGGVLPDGGTPQYFAPNLTPSDAGIGSYSIEELKNVLRTGLDREKRALSPVMPYSIYATLSDVDAESIALYLKSLAPNDKVVPANTAAAPASPAPALVTSTVPQPSLPSSDPRYLSAMNGRYLSILACLDCHTPRDAMGRRKMELAFGGGRSFGPNLKSANITPDSDGGIGKYSVADFHDVLKTGMRQGKPLCPTMPAGPPGYGKLTDADLNSMGQYLLSIPALDGGPYGSTNRDGGC